MAAAPLNNLGILGAYPQANLFAWDASPNGVVITAGDVIEGLDAAIGRAPAWSTSALASRSGIRSSTGWSPSRRARGPGRGGRR